MALGASSHFNEVYGQPVTSRSLLDESRQKVRNLVLATDILGTTTLIAVGISLYLTTRPSRQKTTMLSAREQASARRAHAAQCQTQLRLLPFGAAFEGSFCSGDPADPPGARAGANMVELALGEFARALRRFGGARPNVHPPRG